ncbi:hypothetical protein P12x_005993 (plasmid) [Tundrisphaera lichenicola]|uniref:hypothetical protein n=1 Tax=Tundrisphaera lichenicola TaxID=2029860 RepID=UPI003EBD1CEA
MAILRRGVGSIRTMGSLVDNRKVRTPAGALLEMSAMANEKLLLQKELARWDRRHVEIRNRLGAIAAKERRLMAVIQGDQMPPGVHESSGSAPISSTPSWLAQIEPASDSTGVASRIKVRELTY